MSVCLMGIAVCHLSNLFFSKKRCGELNDCRLNVGLKSLQWILEYLEGTYLKLNCNRENTTGNSSTWTLLPICICYNVCNPMYVILTACPICQLVSEEEGMRIPLSMSERHTVVICSQNLESNTNYTNRDARKLYHQCLL